MGPVDQNEQIEKIAHDTGAPAEQVRQTYLETLHMLSADARIHDYLALLVARRVMAAYRMRRTPPR